MLNWYLQSGKESDVVISCRIRLARNISGVPFIPKANKEEKAKIEEQIKKITPQLRIWYEIYDAKRYG